MSVKDLLDYEIVLGETAPTEVDTTTTANTVYMRFGVVGAGDKEPIVQIAPTAEGVAYFKALAKWEDRVSASYVPVRRGR